MSFVSVIKAAREDLKIYPFRKSSGVGAFEMTKWRSIRLNRCSGRSDLSGAAVERIASLMLAELPWRCADRPKVFSGASGLGGNFAGGGVAAVSSTRLSKA
jgi:hypothetical protein